jgi:DNA-binding MarR family transcriptional regulator
LAGVLAGRLALRDAVGGALIGLDALDDRPGPLAVGPLGSVAGLRAEGPHRVGDAVGVPVLFDFGGGVAPGLPASRRRWHRPQRLQNIAGAILLDPESAAFRASAPVHRALVLALLDLGIEIDTEGQAAAALIGINQTDLICLNALFRQGALTAGQLAATIGLTSGATTTAIDRLERAGYVHRQPDPSDRRRVLVEPSREGAHQAFSLVDDLLERTAQLSASYSDDQLTLLLELLDRFRALIAEHTITLRAKAANNQPTTPRG